MTALNGPGSGPNSENGFERPSNTESDTELDRRSQENFHLYLRLGHLLDPNGLLPD